MNRWDNAAFAISKKPYVLKSFFRQAPLQPRARLFGQLFATVAMRSEIDFGELTP
jgi:hypothetical protein